MCDWISERQATYRKTFILPGYLRVSMSGRIQC